ncbi:MAG: hypothetical protein K0S65_5219, partial [Labilithrix sp.]|nr:hypothetical protein [Labilithrix sp.]
MQKGARPKRMGMRFAKAACTIGAHLVVGCGGLLFDPPSGGMDDDGG